MTKLILQKEKELEQKEREIEETKKEIESLNKGLTLSPQRKRMKKEIDYKPSSVRWNELRQENLVPSFNKIIHLLKPENLLIPPHYV